jgi:hypothetical protein
MKKQIFVLLAILGLGIGRPAIADEGMWPLFLISQLQDSMQARGLKLTAEDIYAINKASMKDAVVRLMSKQNRMFCTGEIVSQQGLFLTNHHCGYGAIQELSSNEDNILQKGFWAKNQGEERPANFNIGLLAKVDDVTSMIVDSLPKGDDEAARSKAINAAIKAATAKLKDALGDDKDMFVIEIVPFWAGNRFLAMYYQVFQDIRLVGTPPENIGKFGGETDNWMWPRHTCDISVFRIYADGTSNKPAKYSKENKPYTPKHYFPVNIQGPKDSSYAMILGYPGRTQRYTYSAGIKYYSDNERPKRVKVRRDILDIYEEYMHKDPKIKLMYADKYAGLSNYWKKFMGEADALNKLNIYERRKAEEEKFSAWVKANNKTQYAGVIGMYNDAYAKVSEIGLYSVYMQDGISNSQPMMIAMGLTQLEAQLKDKSKKEDAMKAAAEMAKDLDADFKEYYEPIEKKVLASVLMHLVEDLDNKRLPAVLISMADKYKRDYTAMAEAMWAKSVLVSKDKLAAFLKAPSLKTLQKDPIYQISSAYMNEVSAKMQPEMMALNAQLGKANRLFQAGMMEINQGKLFNPDANGTMRMTYGRVLPYNGKDATFYKEFTTSRGVVEKYTPGDIEFDAPVRLIDMMKKRDFGAYADKDGELHVCFLTDNDITGGNSGSPVINGNGELIGTAFDGNWEAIASDFAFEPQFQRTICVDVRYTLFIMDKFGGAGHLLNEMKIIR